MVRLLPTLDLHPRYQNARYTLRGVFRSEGEARTKAEDLLARGFSVYVFEEPSPQGNPLYFVAAKRDVSPAPRAGFPQNYSADWVVTRFAVHLFRQIARSGWGGGVTRWYKSLDFRLIRRTLTSLDWSGPPLDVTSRMVSALILAHPFPNANHRTSIDLGRYYLKSCGVRWPGFTLRGRGRDRMYRETKPVFVESKYLLQLIRHRTLLEVAHAERFDKIRVGPEAVAPIRPADLRLDDDEVRRRHVAATARMVRDLASEAHLERLRETPAKSLRDWADWIRSRFSIG